MIYLNKDVPRYSEVDLFHCVKPLDEFLSHANTVLVQQEPEDCAVAWEKFQSANAVQESFSTCWHVLIVQHAQQQV